MANVMSEYVTVVTGGSNGIGEAICRHAMAAGDTVVNIDIVAPLRPHAGAYHFVMADLSDAAETRRVAAEVAARFNVSGLVNNAGVARTAAIADVTDKVLDHGVNLHVRAALILLQAFLPKMKARGYGRVVNMSSRAILGKKARTVYGGTKAALVGMTRTWALELGADGITVNALAPGPIVTELFKKSNTPEQARRLIDTTVVGRGGTPDDVALAACYFLSPGSGFVTGQLLHVCGGASIGSASW